MQRIEWVFFDIGNTIVDFNYHALAEICGAVTGDYLESRGPQVWLNMNREFDKCLLSGQEVDVKRFLLTELMSEVEGFDIESLCQRITSPAIWNKVNEEAIRVVEELKSSGLKVAVISNSDGTAESILNSGPWKGKFEFVIDSHTVNVRKPNPKIFEIALDRANVNPDGSIYVGDLPAIDIRGAIQAGMHAVLFDPHNSYRLADPLIVSGSLTECHRITALHQLPLLVNLLSNKRCV